MIVVFDYETCEVFPDGSKKASTEFFKDTFRVDSCAFTYRKDGKIVSDFVEGEAAVHAYIAALPIDTEFVPFNLQFEMGVTKCRFPDLKLKYYCDVMRLAQLYDNGGDESAFEIIIVDRDDILETDEGDDEPETKKVYTSGFSLVKAAKRILGKDDHKEPFYKYLRQNCGVKEGYEGGNLHLLPRDLLEKYNCADTEVTLDLLEYLEGYFLEQRFDWRLDNQLFQALTEQVVNAQIRGVPVDRPRLSKSIEQLSSEMAAIEAEFSSTFSEQIKAVERIRLVKRLKKYKTFKGKKKYLRTKPAKDWSKQVTFNPGSNNQLKMLFVDVLGIEPQFFSPKGAPSFKSSLLSQWGSGGELLKARRKRLLVKQQCENLYKLSERDGRFHLQLKVVGTRSGRAAGGSNV